MLNTQVTRMSVNLPKHNLVNTFYMYTNFPSYRLTYTRDFGNANLRQMRKRVTGAEEVKQRVE